MGKTCGIIAQSWKTLPWRKSSWILFDQMMDTCGGFLLTRGIHLLTKQLHYDHFIVPMDDGVSREIIVTFWLHNMEAEGKVVYPAEVEYLTWEGQLDHWSKKKQSECMYQVKRSGGRFVQLKRPESEEEWTARDRYLVERCDRMLVIWDHSPDPVEKTIAAARAAGIQLDFIDWRK